MAIRAVAVLSVVAVLVAGCSDPPRPEPVEQDLGLQLEATATTGVIRGIVVDEAIRPLENVLIALTGTEQSTTTNVDGAFGFSGLEPGTYFLQASKLGYFPVQASADVVAGESEPPLVRVLLNIDAATQPYWEGQVYDGYVQCTTSFLVLCGAPEVLTGEDLTSDNFAWDQYFSDNASHLQTEMVWDSTQALSPELYFELEALNADCDKTEGEQYEDVGRFLNSTRGPSPIYATVNATEVQAWKIGQTCPIWVSVFSGGIPGAPCGGDVPGDVLPNWCVGFTVQQKLTFYFHTFHGYVPTPGWRFSDGTPVPEPPR